MPKIRVAAYVRIASASNGQYAKRQASQWERVIKAHEAWEFAGAYIDVGTPACRAEFLRLLDDCKHRKVDLIVTRTATRFGRNLIDAMNTVRELCLQYPSVGVLFEKENLDTAGDGNIPALLFLHKMVMSQHQPKKTAYAAARA